MCINLFLKKKFKTGDSQKLQYSQKPLNSQTHASSSSFSSLKPSLEQLSHAQTALDQIRGADASPKYYNEVFINADSGFKFKHADWRFFKKDMIPAEYAETLNRVVRAWSCFTVCENFLSWLAHGTLLWWYWNGLPLPWDEGVDLQAPVAELDRLACKYINTLIVELPEQAANSDNKKSIEGSAGRYLFEVVPTYVERRQGNGNNMIDAWFVDVDTGLYIDITGLAHIIDEKVEIGTTLTENDAEQFQMPKKFSTLYGCKSYHYYSEEDVLQLRLSLFEGAPIYVPNNYKNILKAEYDDYDKPTFDQC